MKYFAGFSIIFTQRERIKSFVFTLPLKWKQVNHAKTSLIGMYFSYCVLYARQQKNVRLYLFVHSICLVVCVRNFLHYFPV